MRRSGQVWVGVVCFYFFFGLPLYGDRYGGGTGSPSDPFLIRTAEHMNTIGLHADDWSKHFKLMADIDLSQYADTKFNEIGYYHNSYPYVYSSFTGVFDGNGHVIRNLTNSVDQQMGYFGLFSYTYCAIIENLTLEDVSISGETRANGGIIGYMDGGLLANCTCTGSIQNGHYAGGLVGYGYGGIIYNCRNDAMVSRALYLGGIAGYCDGRISRCHNTGYIYLGGTCGGIAGTHVYGVIDDCVNSGKLESYSNSTLGGIAGSGGVILGCNNLGEIKYILEAYSFGAMGGIAGKANKILFCSNHANLSGGGHVGGLVGWANIIEYSYNRGNIKGTQYVGGLAGEQGSGSIRCCYNTGSVEGMDMIVGGLVGYTSSESSIYQSFNTGSVTGRVTVGGLVGHFRAVTIEDCYNTGSVSQQVDVRTQLRIGGLVGMHDNGMIINCYNVGLVSGFTPVGGLSGSLLPYWVTGSFWDMEKCRALTNTGGKGLRTEAMLLQSTYENAGWDFAGESANGTNDIWRMRPDRPDYPRLSWQFPEEDFTLNMKVDMEDWMVLAKAWLREETDPAYRPECDLDMNGMIDLFDLLLFTNGWMQDYDLPFTIPALLPSTNPVHRWTFDGMETILHDVSGGSDVFPVNMDPVVRNSGFIQESIRFDGIDDYLRVEDSESLNFGPDDDFSVCCWFKTNQAGTARLLSKRGPDSCGYTIFLVDDKASFNTRADTTVEAEGNSWCRINNGQWHHVTGVRRAGESLQLYLDGILVQETIAAAGRDLSNDMPLTLGTGTHSNPEGDFFYQGLLDDVRIYDRALNPSEILHLAYYEDDSPLPVPQSHWRLDEEDGLIAYDQAGGYDGVLRHMEPVVRCEGVFGESLVFDGVDDYVEMDGFAGVSGEQARTECAWIKIDQYATADYWAILSYGGEDSEPNNQHPGERWLLGVSGTEHVPGLMLRGAAVTGSTELNDNKWHHLAVVLEDADGDGVTEAEDVLIYVDGRTESLTFTNGATPVHTKTDEPVRIGAANFNGVLGGYFKGCIDDVRLYNRALSGNEIFRVASGEDLPD